MTTTNFMDLATSKNFLNRGAYGEVYGPILWKRRECAVKKVLFGEDDYRIMMEKIAMKKDIWTSLEHRNLIRIYGAHLNSNVLGILMEYATGRSLNLALTVIGNSGFVGTERVRIVSNWLKQIAEGMLYLHNRSLVHRDLKPGNILLMEPFDPTNPHKAVLLKISDFDEISQHESTVTMSVKGTAAYMAPEVLATERFSKSSDVWSYGVVVLEMLTGENPYKGWTQMTLMRMALLGIFQMPILESIPEDYKQLVSACVSQETESRPSFRIIVLWCGSIEPAIKEKFKLQKEGDEVVMRKLLKQTQPAIYGLTILNNEVFISYLQSSVIDVYDSTTFMCKRRLKVNGLTNPEHIVSCVVYCCLYSFDWSYRGMTSEILSIDPHTGKIMKNWKTLEGGGRLSVAADTNIILNINYNLLLKEYTADGELLRRINLSSGTDIVQAWHAIKLESGKFLVCHGAYGDPNSRVCLMSVIENDRPRQKYFDAEVVTTFGNDLGNPLNGLKCPIYLAVDKESSILVCDVGARRLLILNSCLQKPRQLSPVEPATILPWRVCVDESKGRYLVAEYHTVFACKEQSDGKVDWQLVLDQQTNTT